MKYRPQIYIFLSLLPANVSAQNTTEGWSRPNVIKTNVTAPFSLYFERAVSQRFALRTSLRALKIPSGLFEQNVANGTLEVKFYTGKAERISRIFHPNGFFINPYIKVRRFKVLDHVGLNPDVYETENVRSLGFGMAAGYQWVFRNGIVLEVFHGVGWMPSGLTHYRRFESDGSVTSHLTNEYYQYDVRSGLTIGYAF